MMIIDFGKPKSLSRRQNYFSYVPQTEKLIIFNYYFYMIKIPTCPFSQKQCIKFCIEPSCKSSAFICKFCVGDQCKNQHIHKNRLETKKWAVIESELEVLNGLNQPEQKATIQLLTKQVDIMIEQIKVALKNHIKSISDCFGKLELDESISETILKLREKRYNEINGQEMKTLSENIQQKNHLKNLKEVQRDVRHKEEKIHRLFEEIKQKINYFLVETAEWYEVQQIDEHHDQIDRYTKKINNNPKDATSYYNRAWLYHQAKKYQKAEQDYTKAIELNPEYSAAYCNRAILYQHEHKYNEAELDFTKAIQINPKLSNAYNARGWLYQKSKKYDLAQQDYTHAIEITPKFSEAYFNRGLLYYTEKRYKDAQRDYSKAIQYNNKNQKAYFNRGLLLLGSYKFKEAESDFTNAIEINPYKPQYYKNRASAFRNLKMLKEAQIDEKKAETFKK